MICAVIVSYNSQKVFRCYESIKDQVDLTVIVDNGTADKDIVSKLERTASEEKNLKIILLGENLGIAAALNKGAFYARENNFDRMITLDQDSEIPANSLSAIMNDFNSLEENIKNKCAIAAYKYSERDIDTHAAKESRKKFKEVKIILTSGNIINIVALEKIGYFEEKLFIDQVDNDIDFRFRKAGYVILESTQYKIIHELGEAKKIGRFTITNHSPIRRYYLSRNSVYILKKYFFFEPKLVSRLFIGSIFGGIFKITFFEKEKFKKYKYICEGIFDGIFNKFGKKHNP